MSHLSEHIALHAVVIAGGSGTRFWPLSRQKHPKQLLNLTGLDTLLHATFKRIEPIIPPERWWMVVGATHADACRAVVPEVHTKHILIEPVARNTAPAIGLAAMHLYHSDPNAIMVVLPADHHVHDSAAFCKAIVAATQLAQASMIVTLGIRPTHPETGYGYIQEGPADTRAAQAFHVARFCEKPDLQTAKDFLADGSFMWNAGIFVMQPKVYLAALAAYQPDMYALLKQIAAHFDHHDYPAYLQQYFQKMPAISIDYGVMEKSDNIGMIQVDCGWSDVGSWSALGCVVPKDAHNNIVAGDVIAINSQNCVLYATPGHMVGVIGMDGVVVVHTEDATLVVPVEQAQRVRDVLEKIGEKHWSWFT